MKDGRASAWRRFFARRLELPALATMVAVGVAILAFLALSDVVDAVEPWALDREILLWFRNPANPMDPIGPPALQEAVRDITALGGFTCRTLFVAVAAAGLLFLRKRRHAIVLIGAVVLAELSNDALKAIYGRARPELVPHDIFVDSHSFPSGHAMLSAAIFLTLAAILASLDPRRGFKVFVFSVAILVTVAVGLSRIYLGVHWPTDVLAGWTLGAAWALLARVALGVWRHERPGGV